MHSPHSMNVLNYSRLKSEVTGASSASVKIKSRFSWFWNWELFATLWSVPVVIFGNCWIMRRINHQEARLAQEKGSPGCHPDQPWPRKYNNSLFYLDDSQVCEYCTVLHWWLLHPRSTNWDLWIDQDYLYSWNSTHHFSSLLGHQGRIVTVQFICVAQQHYLAR